MSGISEMVLNMRRLSVSFYHLHYVARDCCKAFSRESGFLCWREQLLMCYSYRSLAGERVLP